MPFGARVTSGNAYKTDERMCNNDCEHGLLSRSLANRTLSCNTTC